jgi:hypothetical protein
MICRTILSMAFALTALAAVAAATSAQASVEISSKPTHNMSCTGGVCAPTDKKAVLNVGDLAAMLSSQDVTVSTDAVAHDIEVQAAVSWDSGHQLTLAADRSVIFHSKMHVREGNRLAIFTNSSGDSAGDLVFFPERNSISRRAPR